MAISQAFTTACRTYEVTKDSTMMSHLIDMRGRGIKRKRERGEKGRERKRGRRRVGERENDGTVIERMEHILFTDHTTHRLSSLPNTHMTV